MEVMRFLLVSVGSSTVHLHDRLRSRRACACSEAGFSSQIPTVLEECPILRVTFCCAFLWPKGLCANDVNKEIFPVYGEEASVA
jgi:hypothetical protein